MRPDKEALWRKKHLKPPNVAHILRRSLNGISERNANEIRQARPATGGAGCPVGVRVMFIFVAEKASHECTRQTRIEEDSGRTRDALIFRLSIYDITDHRLQQKATRIQAIIHGNGMRRTVFAQMPGKSGVVQRGFKFQQAFWEFYAPFLGCRDAELDCRQPEFDFPRRGFVHP
jgi:hypothetical protein